MFKALVTLLATVLPSISGANILFFKVLFSLAVLHDAALHQDMVWTEALLKEPGIKDEPGDDGLTGFAIALGYMNIDMAIQYLQSDVEPKDHMLFLAAEVLNIPPKGDIWLGKLQETIKSITVPSCQTASDQRIGCRKVKYPLINPHTEYHDRYYKNKKWLKQELSLNTDTDLRVKLERMQHLILGKFCIETTALDGKWKLQDIKTLSCVHKSERSES